MRKGVRFGLFALHFGVTPVASATYRLPMYTESYPEKRQACVLLLTPVA